MAPGPVHKVLATEPGLVSVLLKVKGWPKQTGFGLAASVALASQQVMVILEKVMDSLAAQVCVCTIIPASEAPLVQTGP